MALQEFRDGHGILAVALDAQGQGLQAPHGQKSIKRPGDGADRVMQIGQPFAQVAIVTGHHHADHHV